MNLLFEEDGAFKTGTILTDNDASLQVETPHGKRLKLKSKDVLMRFAQPSAGDLLDQAETEAEGFDTEFLWEACGDEEFAFTEFAREYFGHVPTPVESAAILLRLHASPIYFHRKGRGRFRKAPAEILQAALAGLEKKRLQAAAIERMRDELLAGHLPEELKPLVRQLLYKPDRNRLETKALEAACAESGQSPARLMLACGALATSHDLHFDRFLFEHFPDGTEFPPVDEPVEPGELPLASVRAFSIDDAATTEIDDAFSVTPTPAGWRIGIHIAAPGLGFCRTSGLDGIARQRLPNGRYEPCRPEHSWNSNHVFSNWATFHLQRHSDHHAHPLRRFQSLRHFALYSKCPIEPGRLTVQIVIPVADIYTTHKTVITIGYYNLMM